MNAPKRPSEQAKGTTGRKENRKSFRSSEDEVHTKEYHEQGYSYGAAPINPRPYLEENNSTVSLDFMTPAAKATKAKLDRKDRPAFTHSRSDSGSTSVGKRKRANTEEHTNGHHLQLDTPMPDAARGHREAEETPLALAHSGLTGGMTRLMSPGIEFPFDQPRREGKDERPSRDAHARPTSRHDDPASPLKRSRKSKEDSSNGLGISIKGRAGKVMSMVGAAFTNPAAAHNEGVDRRRNSSSDHGRDQSRTQDTRKKHRVHRYNGTSSDNVRYERSTQTPRHRKGRSQSPEASRQKVKAIEYHKSSAETSESDSDNGRRRGKNGDMVIFGAAQQTRVHCESFLAFVTKGPESDRGCSVHKALKRWHRDTSNSRSSSHSARMDDEGELWRSLRLRKNDQGEIVVFF